MKRKRELIDDILDPNYNFENVDYDHDPDAHYSDNDIKTKCLKCGFEENVPDFIYDEFTKKKFHKEIRKIVPTLNCQRCDHEKFIPNKYFKN